MAQLPPKVPTIAQNWAPNFPHHRMANFSTTSSATAVINHPASPPPSQQHCWMDEFLDFSSVRRGAHHRSASDSIAFIESPLNAFVVDDGRINPIVHGANNIIIAGSSFDRLDNEQLMSMFSDDVPLPPPTVTSSSNPSSPSDQNSNNDEMMMMMMMNVNNNGNNVDENNASNVHGQRFDHRSLMQLTIDCHLQLPKSEPGEVDSLSRSGPPPPTSPADPKRVKRILANRQSAQRSRVRKLQYISELECIVTSLQSEVSALSPRVAFLDHQRLILNVDNSALKQRIAALAQDKLFKDAHQEALKKEIERLRQVYHHQTINKNMDDNGDNNNLNAAAPPQQHHNPANIMLRTDHNNEPQQILT